MSRINFKSLLTCGFLFLVALVMGCGSDNGTRPSSQLPIPGAWRATADFGTFDFTVNPQSTAITEITYNFTGWTCGIVTRSGSMSVSTSVGWSISARQCTIENSLGFSGDETITITATFNDSGNQCSGTWQASILGTTCSGTWTAVPVN